MADEEIIDAEWEEVPQHEGVASHRLKGQRASGPNNHRDDADQNPWTSADFWKSLALPAQKIFLLLVGLVMLVILAGILFPLTQASRSPSNVQAADPPGASQMQTDQQSAPPAHRAPKDQIVGTWIGAKSGGSDGLTDCRQAANNDHFFRRQGNTLGLMRYDADTSYRQIFVDQKVDAQVQTEGSWAIDGNVIALAVDAAGVGKMADASENLRAMPELRGTSMRLKLRFDGPNVMSQTNTETGVTNRLVRCR